MSRFTPLALAIAFAVPTLLVLTADCKKTDGGPIVSPDVISGVEVGLDAVVCFLRTYSADKAKGQSEVTAIGDATIKCGLSEVQANNLLAEHHAATALEMQATDAGR